MTFLKLKPGHFGYCFLTLDLIHIFCFSRPPLILSNRGSRGMTCYCHVGVEVQVPHSASVDTGWGSSSLFFLGRCRKCGSLLGFHWKHPGLDGEVCCVTVPLLASTDTAMWVDSFLLGNDESLDTSLRILWHHPSREVERESLCSWLLMVWVGVE